MVNLEYDLVAPSSVAILKRDKVRLYFMYLVVDRYAEGNPARVVFLEFCSCC